MEERRADQLQFDWGQREPAASAAGPGRPVEAPMLEDGTAVRVLWAEKDAGRWLDGTVRSATATGAHAKLTNGRIAVLKPDGTGVYQAREWVRAAEGVAGP